MKIEKTEKSVFINVLHNHCIATKSLFWKSKAMALDKDTETFYIPEKDCYYSIYTNKMPGNRMFGKKKLVSYISNDEECHIPIDILNELDCISMSANIFDKIKDKLIGFKADYGYDYQYDNSYIPPVFDTKRYSTVNFDFANEQHYTEASNMLHEGEEDDWMLPENIKKIARQYKEYSVFDPDLWIFVKDNLDNKLVGVDIWNIDTEVKEAQNDWLYILPQYQGKGAGRFLINEAVNRFKDKVKCIHAGGTNEFYKKCGFSVKANYSVWAIKEGYEFIASCVQPNVLP